MLSLIINGYCLLSSWLSCMLYSCSSSSCRCEMGVWRFRNSDNRCNARWQISLALSQLQGSVTPVRLPTSQSRVTVCGCARDAVAFRKSTPTHSMTKGFTPVVLHEPLSHGSPVAARACVVKQRTGWLIVQRPVALTLVESVVEEDCATTPCAWQQCHKVMVWIPSSMAAVN